MTRSRRPVTSAQKHKGRVWLWVGFVTGTAAALGLALTGLALATGLGLGIAVAVASTFLSDLPNVEQVATVGGELFQTTTISDREGRRIGELLGEGRRTVVAPEDIPQVVTIAAIAAEDATFYENPGVELRAIARALWQNFRGGQVVSGASTITQQLVKNVLLTPEETYERKLREAVLAWQISQRFSKDEILGLYLNQNYYGSLAYGVAAAAQTYFGKQLEALSLAEAAMLAGVLPSPSTDNPHVSPEAARRGQLRVLAAIERHGLAPRQDIADARTEKVVIVPKRQTTSLAPHFLDFTVRELQQRYGPEVSRRGWTVITTLDLALQASAQAAIVQHLDTLSDKQVSNAGLVALRPTTGEILAMVGSVDFDNKAIDGQVNVTTALRQPGSAFKIFTYASALEQGWSPATMLLDIPTTIPIVGQEAYRPRNYDRKFRGPVSVRTALGSSLNVPAVRTQVAIGVDATIDVAERLGVSSLTDRSRIGPAMALGSNEVRLIELTSAYAALANQGRFITPVAILCIRDGVGRIVDQYGDGCAAAAERREVTRSSVGSGAEALAPEVAYLMTSILSDSTARIPGFGQARDMLELNGRPSAVKTGTTENTRDALTVGFTPQLATGVWVGNSDGTPMKDVTGLRGASPIWKRFMEAAHKDRRVQAWVRPPTIVIQEVDPISGLLPTPFTPETIEEEFVAGAEPTQRDPVHQPFRVHIPTGLLATPEALAEQVEERVYVVLPTEAEAWQRSLKPDAPLRLPPDAFAATTRATAGSVGVLIEQPTENEPVRSILEVTGAAGTAQFVSSELHYGVGFAPASWTRIGGLMTQPRPAGVLGAIDTIQLEDGPYALRLTVRSTTGGEIVYRRFVVDNTPPQVEIRGLGTATRMASGKVMLGADVADANGVATVRFVVNGETIGIDPRVPFEAAWAPEPGEHIFRVIATDRAGNVAETLPVALRSG
jgi:penicillin-binding protein 1C